MSETISRTTGFVRYAWFSVVYTIGVILWGAVVRATGSGAGCGNHWPVCNGEIIPRAESIETMIEFSHRLTSAFSGLLVLILLIWAFRLQPVRKFVRRMALLSFIFILIEGGIGAALVRLELVEDNASVLRAVAIGLHLVNTLVLLAWMSLTAWGAQQPHDRPLRLQAPAKMRWLVGGALLGFSIISAAGAVTALGDTLFLSGAIGTNTDGTQHFLISLRVWHPILSVIMSFYFFAMAYYLQRAYDNPRIDTMAMMVYMGVGLQLGVGILNIFLKAPVIMQVIHLLIADLLWILFILFSATVLTTQPDTVPDAATNADLHLSPASGD